MIKLFEYLFKENKNNYSKLILDFSNELIFSNKCIYDKKIEFKISDISFESLDSQKNINIYFSIYENITKSYDRLLFQSHKIKIDLFVISPGYIGREYNKTPSFQNIDKNEENKEVLFEVVFGCGYILIQDVENPLTEINIIKIKEKDFILIEKGKCFTVINSTINENLILACLREKDSIFKSNILKFFNGNLLYYTKNGFLKNNNISGSYVLNEHEGNYIKDLYFDKNKGLYLEVTSLPEKFNFLKE